MKRREAKRIACLTTAKWLGSILDVGAESAGGYDLESQEGRKIEAGIREIIQELALRADVVVTPRKTS